MDSTPTPLTPFEIFLLCPGNPENRLPGLIRVCRESPPPNNLIPRICPALWAARWISLCAPQAIDSGAITEWAATEILNRGSHQRSSIPPQLELLKGSGRWHAQDGGGHWGLLLKAALAWADAGPVVHMDFGRAATILALSRAKLAHWWQEQGVSLQAKAKSAREGADEEECTHLKCLRKCALTQRVGCTDFDYVARSGSDGHEEYWVVGSDGRETRIGDTLCPTWAAWVEEHPLGAAVALEVWGLDIRDGRLVYAEGGKE